MNDQNNQAAVSDKANLADADLDKVSGGDILREVVRKPPPAKPVWTNSSGGITHEDSWNAQT